MTREPETVTFQKKVKIVDADGEPIFEGSVLKNTVDGETGVVTYLVRKSSRGVPDAIITPAVGDIHIRICQGLTRVTNCYSKWRHVPYNEQTYEQRLLSWKLTYSDDQCPYGNDKTSTDERRSISGIMSLLPEDYIDWDCCSGPYSVEEALEFLVGYLTSEKELEASEK